MVIRREEKRGEGRIIDAVPLFYIYWLTHNGTPKKPVAFPYIMSSVLHV